MSVNRHLGRVLALLILAGFAAASWRLVAQPIVDFLNERADDDAIHHKLLESYQRRLAARPSMEQELTALRARDTGTVGMIEGGTANLAAATLQENIRRIVEMNGGQVRSAQGLPAVKADALEKIEARFDLSLPETALAPALQQMESALPYIFIDSLEVSAMETARLDGSVAPLSIRCSVHAYRWASTR